MRYVCNVTFLHSLMSVMLSKRYPFILISHSRICFLHARMNPLHVRLQVPFAIALVAAVRATLRLVLPAGGLHVLHKMMLPSVRLGTFRALVPIRGLIDMLDSKLAIDVATGSAGCTRSEHPIVPLPDHDST